MRGGLSLAADTTLQAQVEARLDTYLRRDTTAAIALGLSGGGDSAALLHLTTAWARRNGRPLLALTVDHALSPSSAAWAREAGAMALRAGARWLPLHWGGEKPRTGLPAAARRARHALLADAARRAGARVILLAHTADDVAEGEWMQCTGAAPTLGRLRPWGPSPAWPQGRDTFLLRPLLDVSRNTLRRWLLEQGFGWIDDPANTDARFARPRARAALAAGGARPIRVHQPPAICCSAVTEDAAGSLRLHDLHASPRPERLLSAALLCVGGGERPASTAEVARALRHLSTEGATLTLAGARALAHVGTVHLARELGRRPPLQLPLAADMPTIWDGRFEITAAEPGWTVIALSGLAARLPTDERRGLRALDPNARQALPVFQSPGAEIRLASPFGGAPMRMRPLALTRLRAAMGEIACEP